MAEHVLILGAGASASCGAPTMGPFLDVAQTLFNPAGTSPIDKSFQNVFSAISSLQAVHSKAEFDLVNLESVFTAFELAKTLGRFPGRGADTLDGLIEDLKKVIILTLERCIKFPIYNRRLSAHGHYEEFFKKMSDQRSGAPASYSVLTFNYDLIVEMALACCGIGVDYGIRKEPNQIHHLPVLKLHGSLNWGIEKESRKIVPWFLTDYLSRISKYQIQEVGTFSLVIGGAIHQLSQYTDDHKQIDDVPVIVPPSWNKADSHRSISAVWARAATELAEAHSIYVVGYSLPNTDSFFRQLYALGSVGSVILKRFWVFDPDPSRKEVFKSLLGPGARSRFEFFEMPAEKAFAHILKTIRPKA